MSFGYMLTNYIVRLLLGGGIALDQNVEIIKTVFSSVHTAPSLRALSRYFASDFVYKSMFRGDLNFEEFCQNYAQISATSELEIETIENITCCYEVKLNLVIIHSDARNISKMKARSYFYFKDNVVQSIVSKFTPSPKQLAYILKTILPFSALQ